MSDISKLQRYSLDDFEFLPWESEVERPIPTSSNGNPPRQGARQTDKLKRVRAYLDAVPPAIEGQGGDQHTYKTCCSVVRGFDLNDAEAFEVLSEWNATCQPPWTERKLQQKIRSARKYGEQPFGGLLNASLPERPAPDPGRNGNSSRAPIPKKNKQTETDAEKEHLPTEDGDFIPPSHWRLLDVAKRADWNCVPLRWTVQDLIAQGNFVIIAAETQTGKTLLGLFLAYSMLDSGQLFGRLKITPVDKILYMGLEDPDRRFEERLADIEHSFPPIKEERFIIHIAPDFTLIDERMVQYLEQRIVAQGFKVVFIDTYQKATPRLTSYDDEKQTIILHRLANLTRKLGVTIIVLDHVRKRDGGSKSRTELRIDDIKGTGGKAQNADCIILIELTPNRKQIKLQSFSKDSDVNTRILLDISPKGSLDPKFPKFRFAGNLEELGAESHKQKLEFWQKVLDGMKPGQPASSPMVAQALGMTDDKGKKRVQRTLNDMAKAGWVNTEGDGRYKCYLRPFSETPSIGQAAGCP